MERQPQQLTQTFCRKCRKMIRTQNYIIHDARCKGPTASRINQSQNKSDIFSNSSRILSSRISNPALNQEEKIPCNFCGYLMTLAELDTHPANCQHQQRVCQDCRCAFPRSLMEQHRIVCSERIRIQDQIDYQYNLQEQERQNQPHYYQRSLNYIINPFNIVINGLSSPIRNIPNQLLSQGQRQAGRRNERQGRERNNRYNHSQVLDFQNSAIINQLRLPQRQYYSPITQFYQLINMLAARRNTNNNPGLTKQEIEKLDKIKYHQKEGNQVDLCTICYCEFEQGEQIKKLSCDHLYHHECIEKWLQTNASCPVCKRSMIPESRNRQPRPQQPRTNRIFFQRI